MSSWLDSDSSGPQWWWSDYHRERWERDQIQDLRASVSTTSGHATRLRSQLAQVQGDLQQKVNRLAAAFDAFVELSDIRAELALHGDAAVARHRVRQTLAAITAGQPPAALELPDVDRYWLVPAARALQARLTGDSAAADRYAARAAEIDGARAAYFLTAATRLAGPSEPDAAQLSALLPTPTGPDVNRAQRLCWLATAAGAFGPSAKDVLAGALRTAVGAPPEGQPLPEPWATAASPGTGAASAVDALAALHKSCIEPEPDAPAADTDAGPSPMLMPLRELVGCLVDEGDEPERALLRRVEELRAVVEDGAVPPAYRPWDDPAGTVVELVHTDIVGGAAPAGARPVAVRAAVLWLRAMAQQIVDHGRLSSPEATSVRIRGKVVAITADGPDQTALSAVRTDIAQAYAPRGLGQRLVGAGQRRQAEAAELERAETATSQAVEQFRQRSQQEAEQQARLDAELDAMSRSLSGIAG
ncbi:MAG TPA: hypothetical protein VGL39_22175 [Jatrophihabitantaceae bacterium]|jgi:hypothetical protein